MKKQGRARSVGVDGYAVVVVVVVVEDVVDSVDVVSVAVADVIGHASDACGGLGVIVAMCVVVVSVLCGVVVVEDVGTVAVVSC